MSDTEQILDLIAFALDRFMGQVPERHLLENVIVDFERNMQ